MGWSIQRMPEMYHVGGQPFFLSQKNLLNTLIGSTHYERNILGLVRIEMQTYDSWLGFGIKSHQGTFYQVKDNNKRHMFKEKDSSMLF